MAGGIAALIVVVGALAGLRRAAGRGPGRRGNGVMGAVAAGTTGLILLSGLGAWMAMAQAPRASGPPPPPGRFAVREGEAPFPGEGEDPAFVAQAWTPGAPGARDSRRDPQDRPGVCDVLPSGTAQGSDGLTRVIVYFPGNGGQRTDGASVAKYLAAQGFLVLAMDDVDRDAPVAGRTRPPSLDFDYASWPATLRTQRAADDKARREARRASRLLDRLGDCPTARARLDLNHVGFWGFSFGGAAASEAAIRDRRAAALANEDGSVFGAPARGVSPTPYLLLAEDEPLDPAALRSPDPARRNYALTVAADHHLWRDLTRRPDHYGFIIRGARHEAFSDLIFHRSFLGPWISPLPERIRAEREAYLLAFFDRYLLGRTSGLLDAPAPPFPQTLALKTDRSWIAQADSVPVSDEERRLFGPD